jgi:hypothetical protein
MREAVCGGPSYDLAAKAVGVGSGTISQARIVKNADPEAFERIKRGETRVGTEYKRLQKMPKPPKPQKIPKSPRKSPGADKRRALIENAAKRHMIAATAVRLEVEQNQLVADIE